MNRAIYILGMSLIFAGCGQSAGNSANNQSQRTLTYDQAMTCEAASVKYNILLAAGPHDDTDMTLNRAIQDAWENAAENDAARNGKDKKEADQEFDNAGVGGFSDVDSFEKRNPSSQEQHSFNQKVVDEYNNCSGIMMRSALWSALISKAVKEASANAAASNAAALPNSNVTAGSSANTAAENPSAPAETANQQTPAEGNNVTN